MERQKNSFFSAIKDSAFSDKIKIFIVEARIGKTAENKIIQRICICEKVENKITDWLITPQANLALLSDKDGIADILRALVNAYPAKKHIVITAGHGSCFGINYLPLGQITEAGAKDDSNKAVSSVIDESDPVIQPGSITKEMETFTRFDIGFNGNPDDRLLFKLSASGNGMKEVEKQQDEFNLLTNIELSEALRSVFDKSNNGSKLDILVMYNCLMQNLFTQYELREAVDYLVAPLTGICHPGYDYRFVFKELTAMPTKETDVVAQLFLEAARDDRKDTHRAYFGDIHSTWKVCAVQLDKDKFEDIQARFASLLGQVAGLMNNPFVLYSLRVANRQVYNYAQHSLPEVKIVDLPILLTYWLEKIKAFPALQSLEMPIKDLLESLAQVRSFHFTGRDLYKTAFFYVDEGLAATMPTGLGIWFPHTAPKEGNLVFREILNPNGLQQIVPNFVVNSAYGQVFGQYIRKFG